MNEVRIKTPILPNAKSKYSNDLTKIVPANAHAMLYQRMKNIHSKIATDFAHKSDRKNSHMVCKKRETAGKTLNIKMIKLCTPDYLHSSNIWSTGQHKKLKSESKDRCKKVQT